MKNSLWKSATRSEPCPICGKPDWCLIATSGEVAVCYRKPSPYLARSGSGWIHRLKENDAWQAGSSPRIAPASQLASLGGYSSGSPSANTPYRGPLRAASPSLCDQPSDAEHLRRIFARTSALATLAPQSAKIDLARIHRGYDGDEVLLDGLALELGLKTEALKALDVRFNRFDSCWSFPMRDAEGRVVGLRYRELGGSRKWSARGSRDGLFYDPSLLASPSRCDGLFPAPSSSTSRCDGLRPVTLYITEGASDTAAALSLGLVAIGRSSCTSGAPLIKSLLASPSRCDGCRPVTIISDNDAPGLAGARALSRNLGNARIITPPNGCKDLREWYQRGVMQLTGI